jgi:hypothetical protein
LLELVLDPRACRGVEDRSLVHHATGKGRKRRFGSRRDAEGQSSEEAEKGSSKQFLVKYR